MQDNHWLKFEPNYAPLDDALSNGARMRDGFRQRLQPRLSDAIKRFCSLTSQPRAMRITAPENRIYRGEILNLINATSNKPVIAPDYINERTLLGAVTLDDQQAIHTTPGFLHQADGGYLLLPATQLLASPQLWPILKSTINGNPLSWRAANSKQHLILPEPVELNVKLIIYGDRALMAELESLEPDLFTGIWMYSEYEQDIALTDAVLPAYQAMVDDWCQTLSIPQINDNAAWKALFRAGSRECEDHDKAPLCPLWLIGVLSDAALESEVNAITAQAIKLGQIAKEYRESYLPNRALEDIHGGHVIIDCKGSEVGQINGLTVVELPGHPKAYGEPARISCVVHFGDGDISDVERKADMGGNIHAKGMMIMQAFISAALDLQQPLPYSASIVFEQSYCEVDGDSASLAELCAVVSSLSKVEVNQQIAVTGAVDQFGRVQAVGGINEKIEGFFHVCAHRGLTGSQGVVLPHANIVNLCLNDEVLSAIKANKFHLWPVKDVHQALPLLTGMPFDGEKHEETLLNRIGQRIDSFHDGEHPPRGVLSRILNWFVQN
ncbi:AAA family ATPase [Thaumasiovibrio sp. DFM-14]|uniref:AAA family ATPase n=1 Tax=Thaumasiovibrio sp. DFM-14 TaxID=3384792 RepID=UPI0039A30759